MKNSVLFFVLLLAFSFGCNKANDVQTAIQDQATSNPSEPNVVAVLERGGDSGCCCNLIVSSTYFGGLSICGLAAGDGPGYGNGSCDLFCTTSCGTGSGLSKTFPSGKNNTFCINSGSPFRITNLGILPIQIYFICNGGTPSAPVWIPVGGSVIYTNDCSGTTILCTAASCG